METLFAFQQLREWQSAVDSETATGEMAVLMARNVRDHVGADEAKSFIGHAYAYAIRAKLPRN